MVIMHDSHVKLISSIKYYSSEKIPFYVNLPSTIVSKCLANVEVARKLERYPISTIELARYYNVLF